MLISIDPSSRDPIYAQIAQAVRGAIADGEVRRGDRLPAARDLAQSLEVNMHTVLRAYTELKDDGLIELRRGRGAIVIADDSPGPLNDALDRLLRLARENGISLSDLHKALDQGGLA